MKSILTIIGAAVLCAFVIPVSVYSQTIRVKAVGDIMLGSVTPTKILPRGEGSVFASSIASYLDSADITFGNLEGVFIKDGLKPKKCSEASRNAKRCYEFGMPGYLAQALKDMHFSVMSMDNNHNSDYGDDGVTYTMHQLDHLGIAYAAKKAPVILSIANKKVAVAAFGHSETSYEVSDLEQAKSVIEELDEKADMILVSFHGGAEGLDAQHVTDTTEFFYGENRGNLVQFAKTVIDAGADLVIGHGPHVLRGIDTYKNKLIIYSLGNFLTYGNINISDVRGNGAIMDIEMDSTSGDFVSGRIIPTKQVGKGIALYDESARSIDLIKQLSKEDFPHSSLVIENDGTISLRNSPEK